MPDFDPAIGGGGKGAWKTGLVKSKKNLPAGLDLPRFDAMHSAFTRFRATLDSNHCSVPAGYAGVLEGACHFRAFSREYITNLCEQRTRSLPEPGALHLTAIDGKGMRFELKDISPLLQKASEKETVLKSRLRAMEYIGLYWMKTFP